jgi:hypothetical protein
MEMCEGLWVNAQTQIQETQKTETWHMNFGKNEVMHLVRIFLILNFYMASVYRLSIEGLTNKR